MTQEKKILILLIKLSINKRRRRRRRRRKAEDNESDSSEFDSDDSFEIRKDDFHAISNIFPNNITIIEPIEKEKLGEYCVSLDPTEILCEPSHCSIKLKVKYKRRYPRTSPIFKLCEIHGVTPSEVAKIKDIIMSIKVRNQETRSGWVFYVIDEINGYLKELNDSKSLKKEISEEIKQESVDQNQEINISFDDKSENEEEKVKLKIVNEINKRNAYEKKMNEFKQIKQNPEDTDILQPIEFGSSIPDLNFDFQSKFPHSRYRNDFEEIQKIGRGGGGHVYQVRNKIDNMIYAVK